MGNRQIPLFVVFGIPESRPDNCPEASGKIVTKKSGKRPGKLPGLVTDRSARQAMSLFVGLQMPEADTSGL